jgi:hypothetical protein
MDDDECKAISGMRIGMGNRNARTKRAQIPICLPRIPHYLIRARARAAGFGSRRETA